jgi:hypothetical protein
MVLTYSAGTADKAKTGVGVAANAFLAERERLLVTPVRDYLIAMAETKDQPSTVAPGVTATTEAAEPAGTPARIFPRPVLDNRRRRAVEASLALAGPGRTVEGALPLIPVERGQAELPLVSGMASGALLGLLVGLARARRKDRRPAAPGRTGAQPVVG